MLQLVPISDLHFPPHSNMFDFPFSTSKFTSRGHGSLTPSHANEAMEFRPEENVDAHSCTCSVETFDKLFYYGVSDAFLFHFRSDFDSCPIHFRSGFDARPILFDSFRLIYVGILNFFRLMSDSLSIHFCWLFDQLSITISITFRFQILGTPPRRTTRNGYVGPIFSKYMF